MRRERHLVARLAATAPLSSLLLSILQTLDLSLALLGLVRVVHVDILRALCLGRVIYGWGRKRQSSTVAIDRGKERLTPLHFHVLFWLLGKLEQLCILPFYAGGFHGTKDLLLQHGIVFLQPA